MEIKKNKISNFFMEVFLLLFLLLPDPFRGMQAWLKTMKPQAPGYSPGPGRESRQSATGAKSL